MFKKTKQKFGIAEYFRNVVFPEQDKYFDERQKHQTITVKGVLAKEWEHAEA